MIKGAGTRSFLAWYEENYGQDALRAAVDTLPEEMREQLHPGEPHLGLLASTWYPAAMIHPLLDELMRGRTAAEITELARGSAEATIRETLSGLYRILFKTMMSPERYRQRALLLFSRYYNTGTMNKAAPTPNSHLSVITGWTSHHPLLCEMLLYTGVYVYRELGCCDVTMRRNACVSAGADACSFVIEWSAVGD